ncbi:T9SS type A sorting domain-containing protein [Hymenobacter negativus]|uniref:T9SS type A sorting domain-containing protein n=1 Tax=Hymenobacter negativus TaxID=2795026 RepID=A0ABS3QCZ6_9BACT|nr:T9SS type A sorting domain-containing protein [Hymenobacter negativus]MBO2008843.1 T9SS type A sorting domain-containing protein [Hymenobacter negativus]
MHKPLFCGHQQVLAQLLMPGKRLMAGVGLLLASLTAQAQTTTVFDETFEGATNSFTAANSGSVNQWFVGAVGGNGPTTAGTRAAFVSNDGGVTNAYTLGTAAITHLYRDVTFPAGQGAVQVSFDWKAGGESVFDYLQVFIVPATVTPIAGTSFTSGTAGVVQLGDNLNLQSAFGRTTFPLPPSVAGTTQRLVFTWRNDAGGGAQPPVALDNITVTARVAAPLSGAYTINSAQATAGTNFTSFTDAAAALNLDGVSGPVTFAVSGGPYIEQLQLAQIPGASATNTVVVNGGGRTIQYAPGDAFRRAVVQLNGTDYTTINNLVIDATGGGTPGTYGYGVLLTNAADNDRITNCTINAGLSSTSTNFAGIVVNGATSSATTPGNSANSMTLEGNTVNGGYYSLSLFGNSTTALNTGNVIRNNNFRDFYTYGIYTGYQDGAQFVGNDISRPLRTSPGAYYGIYTFGGSRGQAIEKNRFHDPYTGNPTSTNLVYGVYVVTSTGGTATTPNDVVNNAFYNLNGNGLEYLIYNSASAYVRIYNNTIVSDDQAATTSAVTYGIYNTGANTDVKNNIVSISRTGSGLKYALYYTVATASNYNDLYTPTGNVGYYNATFATLANWQTANGAAFDQNSISADPVFAGASAGNLQPDNVLLNNVGTPLARVTEDISGTPRGAAPDLGAVEFTALAVDVAPVSLLGPAAGAGCFGPAEAIIVQVRNNGTAALNFASNPATVTVVATWPGGTTQTFTGTVASGTLASGATQAVTLTGTLDMTALGSYSFAITATVTGDLNSGNNLLPTATTRTTIVPIAGTLASGVLSLCGSGTAGLALTGAAGGNLQYQTSPDNVTFTDIVGATAATYTTPTLTTTTYYRVRSTCNANTVYSNAVPVTVNNPVISAAPSPLNTCAGATALLSATVPAGISVRYFAAAAGGTAVGTGNPFTTPVLTANATYYAEAFAATTSVAGLADNSSANGTFSQSTLTDYALGFAVTQAGVLTSVDVYPTSASPLTIRLYRVSGSQPGGNVTAVAGSDVTITPTATQVGTRVTVPLNYPLAAGDYKLATSVGGLGRFSTYTGTYPLTSVGGIISVKGSYTLSISTSYSNTTYNSFFNLTYRTECVGTTRTPIQVNVTPGLVASLPAATANSCGLTPYQLAGAIAGTATGATYTSSGTGTFAPNATTLNATYTPSAADLAAGTVTLTLTPTGPTTTCIAPGQVMLTLVTPPNPAFSYPAGTYCTGSAAPVAPVLATGAVAGTFTTSGSGLRIDPVTGVINLAATTGTGTYTITNTVTTSNVCSGATSTATITIAPGVATPTLTAQPQPGGGVQLSTNPVGGVQYQFFVNGVAVGPPSASFSVLVPNVPTNASYTVVLVVPGGCSSAPSSPVLVTATATASLNGVSLRVYPNPTTDGLLTLELNGPRAKASQLTVLNALGQLVHTGPVPAGTVTLHLSRLAAGVYTIRVQTAEGVLTQRIVRE